MRIIDNNLITKSKALALSFVLILAAYSITMVLDPLQLSFGQTTVSETSPSLDNLSNASAVQQPQVNFTRMVIVLTPEARNEVSGLTDDSTSVTSNIEQNLANANVDANIVSQTSGTILVEIQSDNPNLFASSDSELESSGLDIDTVGMNASEQQELSTFLTAKSTLENDPDIDGISPYIEYEMQLQTLPNGINRVDADLMPILAGDGQNDVMADIAILDTGVNAHPDLNLATGPGRQINFVTRELPANIPRNAQDNCGHGTHVAGTAAAKDNNFGVVGSAPGATIWNLKVLELRPEPNPEKRCSGSNQDISNALLFVADNADKIDVVNLSLGGRCVIGDFTCEDPAFEAALRQAVDAGVVVVVSAGNSRADATNFTPARFEPAVTVSAITDSDGKCGGEGPDTSGRLGVSKDDTLALFSNHGHVVDIAAPGVNINSTSKDGGYITLSGTSMAAPNVAGAAASYIASNRVNDPSPSDVLAELKSSASNSETECDGTGHGYFTSDRDAFPEPLLYTALTNQSGPTSGSQSNNTDSATNIPTMNMTAVGES